MTRILQYTLRQLAKDIHDILRSDRDCFIGQGGMTGEGKSVGSIHLCKEYALVSKTVFNMDRLTWSRDELLKWIDGDETGKGQLPEYSAILPDELISMFYKRNWYEDYQKAAIELFNKCRDRHLFVIGNVPNFWDLDSGVLSRFRFYIFIPQRGVMWVFKQENNPFCADKWNVNENRKLFRKHDNPYQCPNFLCEIHYPDLNADEKKAYYAIRNQKRRATELQNKEEKIEAYRDVKKQRDSLIRYAIDHHGMTHNDVAEVTGLSRTLITFIYNGKR